MDFNRRWRQVLCMAAVLAAAAAGGFLAMRTTNPSLAAEKRGEEIPIPSDPKNAASEKAIRDLQSAYVKSFNAGDAKALAAFWAPDGEFVDAEGHSFHGRKAIEKEFSAFFAQSRGLTLEVSTESLRFVSPDVALESGRSRLTRAADKAVSGAAYSIVHTRRDGKWQLASVREAPYAPASSYENLRDLEWLVGTWTAKPGDQTLTLTCEWAEKRNFLNRKYSLKATDGTLRTGLQIVAWDPILGKIRSWVFDADGGFGSEIWTRDGKRWVQEATAVTRDGGQTASTNVLTQLDHDNFTWQSVERSLNQVRLPDTALVKVSRVKSKK